MKYEQKALFAGSHFPLTPEQREIWFGQVLEPQAPIFNIGTALAIGHIDVPCFAKALACAITAHDTLRTVLFTNADTAVEPQQRILSALAAPLDVCDLGGDLSSATDVESRALALMQQRLVQPFVLLDTPLWDCLLVLVAEECNYFILRCHHLLFDGGSLAVLLGVIERAYAAFLEGAAPVLTAQRSHAEFVQERLAYAEGPHTARDAAFWQAQLSMTPPPLFTRGGGKAPSNSRCGYLRWALPRPLFAQLDARAKAAGGSVAHALIALLAICFARLRDTESVAIGTLAHNRVSAHHKSALGPFVSALPLVVQVDQALGAGALIANIAAQLRRCYRHKRLALSEIQRSLAAGISGRRKAFDVGFSFDNFASDFRFGGVSARLITTDIGHAQSPFSVSVLDYVDPHVVALDLRYQRAFVDDAEALRLRARLQVLAEAVAADDTMPIWALPLMGERECTHLRDWAEGNDPPAPVGAPFPELDRYPSVQACVADWARRTPHAIAVRDQSDALSYLELEQKAAALAQRLRRAAGSSLQGAQIGLCVGRNIGIAVAALAILRVGAAYVPLDPSYPEQRLRDTAQDAALHLVVVDADTAALPALADVQQLLALETGATAYIGDATADSFEPLPDAAAYLIYTSGSSGRPKGVVVTCLGLHNVIHAYQVAVGLRPGERALHAVSIGFDAGTAHLFLSLCSGATLIVHDAHAAGGRELAQALVEERVAYVGLPVSVISALDESRDERDETALPALRVLSTGTEACPQALVDRWGRGRRFINIYGPTETSVCTTMAVYDDGRATFSGQNGDFDAAQNPAARPPIGRPIRGARVYVLDAQLRPVPMGAVGELYIAGAGVARGYYRRPELTAERFLPDPFDSAAGERMYRSGDRVRVLNDGALDFVGRVDAQIKLRGVRIEPGEIEALLRAHPALRAAAVTVYGEGPQARLIAYIVVAPDLATPEDSSLRAWLQQYLPVSMLPAAFVALARLPLTANGKLDRAALPPPQAPSNVAAPPRDAREVRMVALWRSLLQRDLEAPLGIHDDFFSIGGHSLLAMRLAAHAGRAFGVALSFRTVFEAPTIAGLCARITLLQAADPVPLPVRPLGAALPLSSAQSRLWFLERMGGGGIAYHIAGALRVHGPLRAEALRAALESLLNLHESLRTGFHEQSGEPIQRIAAPKPFVLPQQTAQLDALPALIAAHAALPFDLTSPPLFRAALVRMSDDDHALLISMHHIIADGWSLTLLIDALTAVLAGDSLPTRLPTQYVEYALWQRQWLSSEEAARQTEFWRLRLQGLPPLLALPSDRPRPRERSGRGAQAHAVFPPALSAALRILAQTQGATLFMALLAGFQALLARLSGETDIAVGTLVANRARIEFEPLIGFFVNTVVLRTQVEPAMPFCELLSHVRDGALEAYAHQDLPFERVVEVLRPARSLAHTPLFQVLFSMQNTPAAQCSAAGLEITPLPAPTVTSRFELSVDVKETEAGLAVEVEYCTDLFSAQTIAHWLAAYQHLLASAAAQPATAVAALRLAEPAECWRHQQRWQGAALVPATGALDSCLPSRSSQDSKRPRADLLAGTASLDEKPRTCESVPAAIAAVAAARSHAPAYISGADTLDYASLVARADRLARVLRGCGVGPETPVAVCLRRTPLLPVAILAIWRAGGAYLPMDPDYPAERLRAMAEDANAVLVLCASEDSAPFDGLPMLDPKLFANEAVWRRHIEAQTLSTDRRDLPELVVLQDDWHPEQLAYLIYTSGSTGRPKAVQVAHGALAAHCHGVVAAYGLCSEDRVLHFAALGFDISLDQLLPPLLAGACIVAREEVLWEPRQFAEKLVAFDITLADLPSALWHVLAREWAQASDLPVAPRLRMCMVGGEAMSSDALRAWRAGPYADVRMLNGYGPAEATITASAHDCTEEEHTATVPIGRPFPGRRFYVLDAALQLLPPDVPGELYIAGVALALGYRGLPGATAAVFLPDPYADSMPGARMYRSGDRVRYRGDGRIEFLGRIDAQVKLHGHRIELEEVESALGALPGVFAAAAAVRVNPGRGPVLVAYLVADADGVPPSIASLREALAQRLPAHFVPGAWQWLKALPQHNGKIDRSRLPTPLAEAQADTSREAQNATECEIAALWAELLGIERVGVEQDFFAIGGHSLLAIRLLARIRGRYGVLIPVRDLFDAPTVAALAAAVDAVLCARRDANTAMDEQLREEIEL